MSRKRGQQKSPSCADQLEAAVLTYLPAYSIKLFFSCVNTGQSCWATLFLACEQRATNNPAERQERQSNPVRLHCLASCPSFLSPRWSSRSACAGNSGSCLPSPPQPTRIPHLPPCPSLLQTLGTLAHDCQLHSSSREISVAGHITRVVSLSIFYIFKTSTSTNFFHTHPLILTPSFPLLHTLLQP